MKHLSFRAIPLGRLALLSLLLLAACTPASTVFPTDTQPAPAVSMDPTASPAPTPNLMAQVRVVDIGWSPLSEHLAYTSTLGALFLTGPDGENPQPLFVLDNCQVCDPRLEWSPDGSHLLVTAHGLGAAGLAGLWLVPLEGEASAIVEPFQSQHPLIARWSPQGDAVAFLREGEVWLYSLDDAQSSARTNLGQNPILESSEPYDRASGLAWAPDGSRLALEVTGNFPSPYSGIALLDLASGETRLLVNGGQAPGWSPDGERVTFQNGLGDWSAGATFDTYAVDTRSGDIFNLTRSNPAYHPFFQTSAGYLPSPYQTGAVSWSLTGAYLYPTLTFSTEYPMSERGPEQGFIIRSDPQTITAEHLGSAEQWYVYPTWLSDGSSAYLAALPEASTAWTHQVVAAFMNDTQVWEGEALIRAAAWSPDGSRLALALAQEGLDLFRQIQIVFPRLEK
jgi:dipeptidyl aminopeptidase/acylaminoacyl peptidase